MGSFDSLIDRYSKGQWHTPSSGEISHLLHDTNLLTIFSGSATDGTLPGVLDVSANAGVVLRLLCKRLGMLKEEDKIAAHQIPGYIHANDLSYRDDEGETQLHQLATQNLLESKNILPMAEFKTSAVNAIAMTDVVAKDSAIVIIDRLGALWHALESGYFHPHKSRRLYEELLDEYSKILVHGGSFVFDGYMRARTAYPHLPSASTGNHLILKKRLISTQAMNDYLRDFNFVYEEPPHTAEEPEAYMMRFRRT